jgi:transcriptional regulator GlxA family with amidase domain
MPRRSVFAVLLSSLIVLGTAGCAPNPPDPREPPRPVPADEQAQIIAAMKPPKRARPVIAVVGQNDGTETTDFIVPYAVLALSGAAEEVVAVAPVARPIRLTPALTIQPHETIAAFDGRYPDGADYVVVPKIEDADDAAVVAWIQAQAAKGAVIVGICSGVKTVSAAGLLAGRSATGHWYDIEELRAANPTMQWVPDRRYVADRGVITTTGVSASLPVSIALVEAIAGADRAGEVAAELGVEHWDARHDSGAFDLDTRMWLTGLRNRSAFWQHETHLVPVSPGVDDVALSFVADGWSRTFRSKALSLADTAGEIRPRYGLTLVPDAIRGQEPGSSVLPAPDPVEAGKALPATLQAIADRYGNDTAAFVALQLEYLWQPAP